MGKGSTDKAPLEAPSVADGTSTVNGGGLERSMNALQGAALIAGAIIGSGIFTNPGKVLSLVGSPGAAMVLWVLGAAVAYFGAMVYGELGCRIPASGGDAPFLDEAYRRPRRLLATVYSWMRVVIVNPGYNASVSITAGTYLCNAFPNALPQVFDGHPSSFYPKVIACVLLALQTVACIPSNNLAGRFCAGVVVVSVACLVFFSLTGVAVLCGAAPSARVMGNFSASVFFAGTSSNASDWAQALFKVMWAYDGWSNLASSLGELRDPNRNVKRATVMGLSTVAVLFVLANIAYIVAMPLDDMKAADTGLASLWATRIFGPVGNTLVSIVIFFVTTACCFITLFSASRVAQATGETQLIVFPATFARLNARFGTPVNALLINFVLSVILLLAPPNDDTFWVIIDLVSYPLWVFYTVTVAGVLVLKVRAGRSAGATSLLGALFTRKADYEGLWVSPLYALLVICVGVFLIVLPFTGENWRNGAYGLAATAVGILPYLYLRRRTA
ncbi:methionine permease [Sorochytrium milnesiophthora]